MPERFQQPEYPSYDMQRMPDGERKLVKRGTSTPRLEETVPPPEESSENRKGISRREFLKRTAAVVAGIAAGGVSRNLFTERGKNGNVSDSEMTESGTQVAEEVIETEQEMDVEREPEGKDFFEQLKAFGEIIDPDAAAEALREEHYHELTETEKGRKRVNDIAARFARYDENRLIEPFKERGLDTWLAFTLPAHESDWISRQSTAGARGTHQLMPETAKSLGRDLGYKTEEEALAAVLDPYKASEIAAEHLAQGRKRFPELSMQLVEYNAGFPMNGFTKNEKDRSKWTYSNLNAFVARRLNEEFKRLRKEGFVFQDEPTFENHVIQSGETLWGISNRYGIDMNLIAGANDIEDVAHIQAGDTLRIPYKNNLEKELRTRYAHTLQMVEYAPHLIAMQDALANAGYVAARQEEEIGEETRLALNK